VISNVSSANKEVEFVYNVKMKGHKIFQKTVNVEMASIRKS
jgi:hypothetical protein